MYKDIWLENYLLKKKKWSVCCHVDHSLDYLKNAVLFLVQSVAKRNLKVNKHYT